MTSTAPFPNHSQPNPRNVLIERIVTGVFGAILLALQGVNIGETGSNHNLIRGMETAIAQQTQLIKGFEAEATRIDKALDNQAKMIDRLDRTLEILDKEQTKK
jgi:hypothetical protein